MTPPPDAGAPAPRVSRGPSLRRSAAAVTALTLISRVLGLVREQVRAALLGTGAASDALGIAILLPNLFRRTLGEGQMTGALVPALVEKLGLGDRDGLRRFFSDFLGVFSFLVTSVVVIGWGVTPLVVDVFFGGGFGAVDGKLELTSELTRVMFPYLGLVSLAATLQAALHAHRTFWPSALTPVLLNISIIGCAWFLRDRFGDPAIGFAIGFVVGGAIQLAFQAPFVLRRGLSLRPRWGAANRDVRAVLRLFLPGVLAGSTHQIRILVGQVIASGLAGGRVAALQFSVRLQELVLGAFVASVVSVLLPGLSESLLSARDGARAASRILIRSTKVLLIITVPAAAGLWALGEPIVRLLFEHGAFDRDSSSLVLAALRFHALGVVPVALSRNAVSAFYASRDLGTPARVGVGILVVDAGLCLALVGPMDHAGIALAGAVSAALSFGIYRYLLARRELHLVDRSVGATLLRTVLAAGAMWIAVDALGGALGLDDATLGLGGLALGVAASVLVGAAVYGLILALLREPELLDLWRRVRR